jgi:hypothetical protein
VHNNHRHPTRRRHDVGMTRVKARRAYTHSSDRGRRYEDFFCLTPIGVRVGYASPKLLRALPRRKRRGLAGRVVWASTSSPFDFQSPSRDRRGDRDRQQDARGEPTRLDRAARVLLSSRRMPLRCWPAARGHRGGRCRRSYDLPPGGDQAPQLSRGCGGGEPRIAGVATRATADRPPRAVCWLAHPSVQPTAL